MPQFVSSQAFNPAALQADDLYVVVTPPPNFIQGLPADILAIIGTASWGPLNQPTLLGSPGDLVVTYGGVSAASVNDIFDLATSSMVAFQQSQLPSSLQLLAARASDGTDTAATCLLKDTTPVTPLTGATANGLFTGTLGAQIEVEFQKGTNTNTFTAIVLPFNGGLPETYPNIAGSAGASSTFWVNFQNAVNNGMTGIRGASQLIRITGASTTALPPALGTFQLSGGTDGRSTVTSSNLIGSDSVLPKTGIYAFRSLKVPPGLLTVSGLTDSTVYATIQAFCDSEGLVGILCLPASTTTAAAITAKQGYGIDDYNIIFVKDWVQWYDSQNGVTRLLQPSPFIGGSIACLRPDISPSNKPVYAVVGTERQNPQVGNIPYSLAEIGQLESNGIMFITNPCPGGNYWGMRHGKNSSSNAVVAPVEYSRMTNFLGHTLQSALGIFIGQNQGTSSTDPTRAKVKATLDAFLQNLQDQGMIDSFLTICDLSNNTPQTIAQHYLYADVMVRYMSSICFFIVSLQGGTTVVTIQNVPGQTSLAAA